MIRFGTVLCFAVSLSFAAMPSDQQFDGLSNFHKVNDNLYRGAQPTADGFKALAGLGIKTVIDLRGAEHSVADEQRLVETAGMRYVSIPMKGMATPTDAQISAVLALMNDPAAGPVFVHCRRGADRTGAVIACYRIRHDHWDARTSLAEARGYGMSWYQVALQRYVGRYGVSQAKNAPILASTIVTAAN